MSFDPNLTKQLEEIIISGLERLPIPYEKGNSIRIKNLIIRKHSNGYRIFNCKTNKFVANTFSKTAALAISKELANNSNFNIVPLTKLDDQVSKHYNDALFAKRTMENAEYDDRYMTAEIKYDIATQKAWAALADIERYIFDK
tara:strand:- start:768 stop:1196 length:429 start_codon:yes stop_codon:yes gene_type:complete